jgi:hypothetical protein
MQFDFRALNLLFYERSLQPIREYLDVHVHGRPSKDAAHGKGCTNGTVWANRSTEAAVDPAERGFP